MSATVPIDRQACISSRIDYVRPIALSIHARIRVLPVDELVQWGCVGLIEACDKMEASKGEISFEAYCKCKIRGAILDQLRRECARRDLCPIETDPGYVPDFSAEEMAAICNRLETKERQVIYLRLEGYTQEEIGRALTIGRSAVVRLERRAIQSIRKLLRRPVVRTMRAAA